METDVPMPEDPPENDDNSKDEEEDADHKEVTSVELPDHVGDGQCLYVDEQIEVMTEDGDTERSQMGRKASEKSPSIVKQGAVFSGKILSFCCLECKGDTTYSPNDLLKHYQVSHQGTLPTYPCDLCSFVTHEFSSLQCHRICHRNPLVTCDICNDGVQYSLLLLTRHYMMCHSQNGQFHCEKCAFSTKDAGTYVQHIHHHAETSRFKCLKCQYISPSRRELQRHLLVHSATFPFTCQLCGYGAARGDYLRKHMTTVHGEENDRKPKWRTTEEKPCVNSPPGLKLLLKKGPVAGGSSQPQWMSKLHTLPGVGLLDQNGRLYNPEKTLEETQQFLERAVRVKKENSIRLKNPIKTEPQCPHPSSPVTPQPKPAESDSSNGAGHPSLNNNNGLTVLMLKNKISIPPNCTTKVMGFRMVDGKKHLVLKVIPTKSELSDLCDRSTAEKDTDPLSTEDTINELRYTDSSDEGERFNSPCSLLSSPLNSQQKPDSEFSTSGNTDDVTKVKCVEMELASPVTLDTGGETEQVVKVNKLNCTPQHTNSPIDSSLLTQSENTDSSPTKEAQAALPQTNGDVHICNSLSGDDALKPSTQPSLPEQLHSPGAHSTPDDITITDPQRLCMASSESTENDATLSHSNLDASITSAAVNDSHLDSSKNFPQTPKHSTKTESSSPDPPIHPTTDSSSLTQSFPSDTNSASSLCESVAGKDVCSDSSELKDTISESIEGDLANCSSLSRKEDHDSVEMKDSDSVSHKSILPKLINTSEQSASPHDTSLEDKELLGPSQGSVKPSEAAKTKLTPSNSAEKVKDSVESKVTFSESADDQASVCSAADIEMPLNLVHDKMRTSESLQSQNTHSSSDGNVETTSANTEKVDDANGNTVCNTEKSSSRDSFTDDLQQAETADVTSVCISTEEATVSQPAVSDVKMIEVSGESDSEKQVNANTKSVHASPIQPMTSVTHTPTDVRIPEIKTSSETLMSLSSPDLADEKMDLCQPVTANESSEDSLALSSMTAATKASTQSSATTSKQRPETVQQDGSIEKVLTQQQSLVCLTRENTKALPDRAFSHSDLTDTDKFQKTSEIGTFFTDSRKSATPSVQTPDSNAQSPECCHALNKPLMSVTKDSTSHEPSPGTAKAKVSSKQACGTTDVIDLSFLKASGPETDPIGLRANDEVLNYSRKSPKQEVFSFHNYSKETAGGAPDLSPLSDEYPESEDGEDDDCSADWSLRLDASPPHRSQSEKGEAHESNGLQTPHKDDLANCDSAKLERVSDSDIEVDECIDAIDEPPDAVETQPVVPNPPLASRTEQEDAIDVKLSGAGLKDNVTVLGRILEKHSEAIINQQLERERKGSSAVPFDCARPRKTTLKILQTAEGKQQLFLQTPDNQYAVPVQLKTAPGFKFLTKSPASNINVSYVKPGMERSNKTTGLALKLNGGRIGAANQTSTGADKGQTHSAAVQLGTSSSGRHYLVNPGSVNRPLLLSGSVKSPNKHQAGRRCYLLQRPLQMSPGSAGASVGQSTSGAHSQQSPRAVLTMPVKPADKTSPVQMGRQAYLVRYISPVKSGQPGSSNAQTNESGKSRLFLKIVRGPNGTTKFLSNVPGSLGKKPIYLATGGLQSPCFLMSSNQSPFNAATSVEASNLSGNTCHQPVLRLSNSLPQACVQGESVISHKKSHLALNQTRMSKRKRKRKAMFDDPVEAPSKARKPSSRPEREEEEEAWAPVSKDTERTLRLSPFNRFQQIKVPRQNQPVVVLNHPDADIPEVFSIMRSVNKFKGDVLKVTLSKRTVEALTELYPGVDTGPLNNKDKSSTNASQGLTRARLLRSTVREHFNLTLKLKKTSRNRYEVMRKSSGGGSSELPSNFSCWFCGRLFNNQEDWIGHGQRHLMEATRDWNKLFTSR